MKKCHPGLQVADAKGVVAVMSSESLERIFFPFTR
jgi:hypothetical protein